MKAKNYFLSLFLVTKKVIKIITIPIKIDSFEYCNGFSIIVPSRLGIFTPKETKSPFTIIKEPNI